MKSHRIQISNLLIAVGCLLIVTPFAMQAYGHWEQARARRAVLRDLPTRWTDAPTPAPAPTQKSAASVRLAAARKHVAGKKATPVKDPAPAHLRIQPQAPAVAPVMVAKAPQENPPEPGSLLPAPIPPAPTENPAPTSSKPAKVAARKARVAQAARPRRKFTAISLARTLPRQPWEPCILQIPSIRVEAAVQRGAGNWRMIPGPAYEPKSAGPGGSGNAVIAAHRNMWDETFMHLPRVRPGEPIYVVTKKHRYVYRVDASRKASTDERDLLGDTKEPTLTLYTCVLPFNKNRRWVVQAHLVQTQVAER